MPTVLFPKPESVGPRIWGHEILLAHAPEKWTLKLIRMHKDAKGGLQKHWLKDEGGVMCYGEMLVRYDSGSGNLLQKTLRSGDVFHFPAGAVHQAEALTDCAYYEVSTPHFNDRVHVESEFGIEKEEGGLPSTELADVELR
jgi:mannose-6-phosphate isomerase-like protein (cupin superfamily)